MMIDKRGGTKQVENQGKNDFKKFKGNFKQVSSSNSNKNNNKTNEDRDNALKNIKNTPLKIAAPTPAERKLKGQANDLQHHTPTAAIRKPRPASINVGLQNYDSQTN